MFSSIYHLPVKYLKRRRKAISAGGPCDRPALETDIILKMQFLLLLYFLMHDGFLSFMFSGDFRFTDELRIKVKQKIGFSFAELTT